VAVEVEGTTADAFPSLEVTANEWEAAAEKADDYWPYLVTRCTSKKPCILPLQNLFQQHTHGRIAAVPALWRLWGGGSERR
jgi:hypothetical protein